MPRHAHRRRRRWADGLGHRGGVRALGRRRDRRRGRRRARRASRAPRSRSRSTAACGPASSSRRTATRRSSGSPSRPRWRTSRAPTPRSRRSSRTRPPSASCSQRLDELLPDAAVPRLEHLVGADHEAGRGHARSRTACSACTSSTPCRCSRWSRSCTSIMTTPDTVETRALVRRGHARQAVHRLPGPRGLRRQRAADPLPAVGDPDVRVRLRLQGGHRPAAWCSAARTRWGRWRCRT